MMDIKLTPKEIFEEYSALNEHKSAIGDRGIFEQTKMNERFYSGDQWHGVQAGNTRPLVRRNIIKRIGEYKISSICASPVAVNYSSEGVSTVGDGSLPEKEFTGDVTDSEVTSVMRALSLYRDQVAERVKLNEKATDMVRDAFISGTSFMYTYWDDTVKTGLFYDEGKTERILGDINCQVLNVANVALGDPNSQEIQSQPYIIISQRKPLLEVKREAEAYKGSVNDVASDDNASTYNSGDRGESEPEDNKRVTVLTKLYKVYENGTETVKAIRVTENAVIRPEWSLNVSLYPIAAFSWMPRLSSAYGDSEVTYLIPNQIAINRALSAAVWSAMITGMPKTLVNRDLIEEAVTNDPGQILTVAAGEEYDVQRALKYVQPPQFASQLQGIVEDIASSSLSDAGATDAALGDLRPDNASAVVAMREASLQPMQVYQARYYACIEEISRIWADFWVNMYGVRPIKIQDKTGIRYVPFNAERYKGLVINAKVDVGASTLWGEAVVISSLNNLLSLGIITPLQYLERVPKGTVPDITGLIEEMKANAPTVLDELKTEYPAEYEAYKTLPVEEQTRILSEVENE
jgi:hypothetical protein